MNTFGFIGFGLIAGSIAKAIKLSNPNSSIVAYTRTKSNLNQAFEEKIIDVVADNIDASFSACDVIFLCAPVKSIISNMKDLKSYLSDSCILTDVGSVKRHIQEGAESLGLSKNFIGGHPMAGSEKSGYEYSSADLLKGHVYILTPSENVAKEKVEALSDLIKSFSCKLYITDPTSHDYAVAGISHLPHLIAASLANTVKWSDKKDHLMESFASTGFLDTTRLAASSPEVWSQICSANGDAIADMLSIYIKNLEGILNSIKNHKEDDITRLFEESGEFRNRFI